MHLLSLTRKLRRKEKRGKAVSILLAPQTPNVDQSAECRRLCFPLNEYKKEKEAGAVIEDRVRRRSGAPSDHTEIGTEDHKILSKHFVSASRLRSTERTLVKRKQ